jgi:predicted peroxiredoxin
VLRHILSQTRTGLKGEKEVQLVDPKLEREGNLRDFATLMAGRLTIDTDFVNDDTRVENLANLIRKYGCRSLRDTFSLRMREMLHNKIVDRHNIFKAAAFMDDLELCCASIPGAARRSWDGEAGAEMGLDQHVPFASVMDVSGWAHAEMDKYPPMIVRALLRAHRVRGGNHKETSGDWEAVAKEFRRLVLPGSAAVTRRIGMS